jgi:hypothetical protein
MADFNFIVTPELRQCLDSDYKELRACLKAQAWKAVHVLAGSIIEAVLIDALASEPGSDPSKLDSMEFSKLIALAKDKGILSDEAVDLSTVIRKYRNLIHPGVLKRLEKAVDGSGAVVAAELVEIVTKQVAKKKQETYGYTAEQLLGRLRGGESALPLVGLLLADTQKPEIERFLIDVLPDAYLHAIGDSASTPEEDGHLIICYRKVFDAADKDVKATACKHLYKIYRTKPEATVLIYEDSLFRGSDLAYLSKTEQGFIKAHFLPRVSTETLASLLYNIFGIGPFLDPAEAFELSSTLMVAMQSDEEAIAGRARIRLLGEFGTMTTESRAEVKSAAQSFGDPKLSKLLLDREAKIKPAP